MTQERLNEANTIADKIAAVDSLLRRIDTQVNNDLRVIVAAVGKERLISLLTKYKQQLTKTFNEL